MCVRDTDPHTYRVDRSSHVYMDPHSLVVEAKMSSDKQASTRALGIATVLHIQRERGRGGEGGRRGGGGEGRERDEKYGRL